MNPTTNTNIPTNTPDNNNVPTTKPSRPLPHKNQYSYTFYEGDGTTALFHIPFPYLDRKNIKVMVDKEEIPAAAIQWLTTSSLRLASPPAVGSLIQIQRLTEKLLPVVDFADGSTLTEEDLDLAVTQLLYICQEAYDALDGETAVAAKEEAQRLLAEITELYGKIKEEIETLYNKAKEEIDHFRSMYIVAKISEDPTVCRADYDFETGRLTFHIPKGQQGIQGIKGDKGDIGRQGDKGDKGDMGEMGFQGLQGPHGPPPPPGDKGPMGDSPWPTAFGHFRLEGHELKMDFTGTANPDHFIINPATGILEVIL